MAFDDRLVAWADERCMGDAGREAVRIFGEDADTAAMAVADAVVFVFEAHEGGADLRHLAPMVELLALLVKGEP